MAHFVKRNEVASIYDSFYNINITVNESEYSVVYGYFMSLNNNKTISGNMAAMIFRISYETKIPAIQLLENIKGLSTFEMNKMLAYYLNSFKSKTTLYGVGIVPQPAKLVARNIVI